MTGLEPATSRPPDACANQLRYIPIASFFNLAGAKLDNKFDSAKFLCYFFQDVAGKTRKIEIER